MSRSAPSKEWATERIVTSLSKGKSLWVQHDDQVACQFSYVRMELMYLLGHEICSLRAAQLCSCLVFEKSKRLAASCSNKQYRRETQFPTCWSCSWGHESANTRI